MIRFGWLSFVLLIGAVQGVVVAVALLLRRENRAANRILAALIGAFVLRLVPFIIGYAGFYDAYPWLSFAPFELTLLYGPLIYLYVVAVTSSALPRRMWLHFVPGLVQVAYFAVIFVQPLAFKNAWDARVHEPFVDPAETVATFVSLVAYLAAAIRRYRHYRAWLRDATTDRDDARLGWLNTFLVVFALTVLLNLAWDCYSAFVHKLSYVAYFPLYVWFALLVYYLGLEGWRNAGRAYPLPIDAPVVGPREPADARVEAERLLAAMRVERFHRDPELTLAKLAQTMGMSPARITRIVNDGLGQNFSEAINRLRVEEVCRRLDDPHERADLLALAFDAGFSSKASFNRAFKAATGVTPSAYRRERAATAQILAKS